MTHKGWMVGASLAACLALGGCEKDDDPNELPASAAAGSTATGGSPGVAGSGGDEAGGGPPSGGGEPGSAAGNAGDGGASGSAAGNAGDGGAPGSAGSAGGSGDELPIAGEYTDTFATRHTITDTTWTQQSSLWGTSIWNITQYDAQAEYVIAQNDSSNDYARDLWSRFDWTTYGGSLWVCQIAYDAETEAAALATERPDDSDPSANGSCGVGTWSELTEVGAGGAGGGDG